MKGPTFEVFTLFPGAVSAFLEAGLVGKAIDRGHVVVHCTDYRDYTEDRHRTVDDTPFGGGPGMVMKIEPVVRALEDVASKRGPMHRILLTPSAPRFDQRAAERLVAVSRVALLCGRYEGIDDRVREHYVDECLSIGDFVLNGGEVAALSIIEAVTRLCEGVVGNPDSIAHDSHAPDGSGETLEHPQYTRPASFRDHEVPAVLLSGDHTAIALWRAEQARARTWKLRPDLRQVALLTNAVPLYLALDAEALREPAPAWATLARHHGLAGIVGVGERAGDWAQDWAAGLGGRIPVSALASLTALRRRLRRAHKGPVALIAPDAQGPVAAGPALLDLLRARASTDDLGAIVLWLSPTSTEEADALFTQHPGEAPGPGLALPPSMIDSPQPWSAQAAVLADGALAHARAMWAPQRVPP